MNRKNKVIEFVFNRLTRARYASKKLYKNNSLIRWYLRKFNCHICYAVKFGKGIIFPLPIGIVIGGWTKIGQNCVIYQNVTIGRKSPDKDEYPTIGNNVIIYPNSVIVGGVKIGNNVIIGAGSIVTHDVDDNVIVAGNPARQINR